MHTPTYTPTRAHTHTHTIAIRSTPVAVLAPGSGLIAWPSAFTCVWSAVEGVALWLPVPPPGFVALGCVATSEPDVPPPLQGVCACVVSTNDVTVA
eukprot:scaffold74342_cov19-Tisochrysis_lutea.AAC.1